MKGGRRSALMPHLASIRLLSDASWCAFPNDSRNLGTVHANLSKRAVARLHSFLKAHVRTHVHTHPSPAPWEFIPSNFLQFFTQVNEAKDMMLGKRKGSSSMF